MVKSKRKGGGTVSLRTGFAFALGLGLASEGLAGKIEHNGLFVSLTAYSVGGPYEAEEVVVPDFGGRSSVEAHGIEVLVNDPWNRLWPLSVALEFFAVPIDIRWISPNQIYVELEVAGWELLYATDLGPELWKPISEHPRSTASGKGWIVDLGGETSSSLFRGLLVE